MKNNGCFSFFFNDTATTEIYTLSLHDALPISIEDLHRWKKESLNLKIGQLILTSLKCRKKKGMKKNELSKKPLGYCQAYQHTRSEEHTSELQSRQYLVCRLLLEKKNKLHSITY